MPIRRQPQGDGSGGPTVAEQGFPEVDVGGWFAGVGPAKLPPTEVKRLQFFRSEQERYARLVKKANIVLE